MKVCHLNSCLAAQTIPEGICHGLFDETHDATLSADCRSQQVTYTSNPTYMVCAEHNVSKRQRSQSLDRATDRSDVKKQCEENHPDRWVPNDRFWDSLPRIHLTHRALAEHDRRCRQQKLQLQSGKETKIQTQRRSKRLQQQLKGFRSLVVREPGVGLQRFARGGGPDLTDVRGYPDPTMSIHDSHPIKLTTASSRKSSPYDENFEMKLARVGILLSEQKDENGSFVMPANYEEIMARLDEPRPSLSPSRFTEQDFLKFRQDAERASTETSTMQRVISTIEGQHGQFHSLSDVVFNHVKPFDPDITTAKPDKYDGALPHTINHRVFQDLSGHIVPSTNLSRPAVPNFFLEGKSRKGRADVAHRQAAYDGAIGARAMMSLQNYPAEIPQYDGKAYTYTNTYLDGHMKMYATHATAPTTGDTFPSYHMTQLNAFAVTGNSKNFREAATFYRNVRDLAKEQRDAFIQQANQAARQTPTSKHSRHTGTPTDTVSSLRTEHRSREYSHTHSPDTDTSANELALENSLKRPRIEPSLDNDETVPPCHQSTARRVRSAPMPAIRRGRSQKSPQG